MNNFSLAWRIAKCELRSGIKGFRVFLICLALGVGAIAAVGSLSRAVTQGLLADARFLLGGDVSVRMQHRPIEGEQLNLLKSRASKVSSVTEMKAMAQTPNNRALVELKGIDQHYPLVGTVTMLPSGPLQDRLVFKDGAWGAVVEQGLLAKLNIKVGDRVRVGEAFFQIRAILIKEPDRVASVLNFGPRFMVSAQALPHTKLIQLGSQIRYYERILLPTKTTASDFIKNLGQHFPEAGWRVRGPDKAAPGLQRFVRRLSLFLTFAGLTALLVGGIGVLGATRSYLQSKTSTIATLKCIGAPGGLVFNAYFLQILILSFIGIMVGIVMGALLPFLGVALVHNQLPIAPIAGIYPLALLKAAVFGMLTSATFVLWPLAQARETPAGNLFRTNVMPLSLWPRWIYIGFIFSGVLSLGALVIFWSQERNFAYWFVVVSLVTVVLLRLGAVAIMQFAQRVPRPQNAIFRLVLANLYRPGTSTPSIVLAMGVGLSVLIAVALIQGNISRQVEETIPEQAPAFFFIDIQPDQVTAFDKALKAIPGAHDLMRMPSMRGRIVKINGVPVDQVDIKPNVKWAVNGDRALTYAKSPAKGTEIVAGKWWNENYQGPPLISFDARVADGFGVGVGDTLTLNVLGRDITATIGSLRRIDWRTLRFDFAIIFAPGTLEQAPQTHIAAIKADAVAEPRIENSIAKMFANISTIRVKDALVAAGKIIKGVGAAVTATASLTVIAGIIVLAGTIATARAQRVYDSVVFKVLGATRRQIITAFLWEFGLLGLFTGIVGALVGTFISWAVIKHIMAMNWVFLPNQVIMTILSAALFTTLIGFLGTWRALGEKSSKHLSNE